MARSILKAHFHSPLYIFVVTALLCQLFGHYFATKVLVFDGFLGLWPILRIIIPTILFIALAIPLSSLQVRLPKFDKASLYVCVFAVICLIGLAIYLGNFADDYLNYYRRGQTLEQLQAAGRFERFLLFTLSTLIAWEIFHRGFLLGGFNWLLSRRFAVEEKLSQVIAMVFVASFESLFHIKKPMLESIPLVFASLALSWLTFRTKSLWPALMIHLAIEVIFGYSAYIGW